MLIILSRFIFTTIFLFKFFVAQNSTTIDKAHNIIQDNDLTVSYSITLKSNKSNTGIGETYNGSIKTVFISGDKVRIRLVSLMRTQSIFVFPEIRNDYAAAIIKESGKDKYKYYLTPPEWKQYNHKYDSVTCSFTNDTAVILNYVCHKAIINLKDGMTMSMFYTTSIKRKASGLAEPLFSCIPGLVLQYEYHYKKGKIIYTATSVSQKNIDPGIFRVPEKGFTTRKFSMSAASKE